MVPYKYRFTAENAEGSEVTYLLHKSFSANSATSAVKKAFFCDFLNIGRTERVLVACIGFLLCHPNRLKADFCLLGFFTKTGTLLPVRTLTLVNHCAKPPFNTGADM